MSAAWVIGGVVVLLSLLLLSGVMKVRMTTSSGKQVAGADAQIKQARQPGIPPPTFSDAVIEQCYYEALKRTQNNCGQPLPKICQGILKYPQIYQQTHINQVWPFELGYYSNSNATGSPGGLYETYSFV